MQQFEHGNPKEKSSSGEELLIRGGSPELNAALMEQARDSDYERSSSAINFLGNLQAKDQAGSLSELLDENQKAKTLVVMTNLGKIKEEKTKAKIFGFLNRTQDTDFQKVSAYALGEIGGDDTRVVLKDLMASSDIPAVKLAAGIALAKIGDSSGKKIAEETLGHDRNEFNLIAALMILSRVGSADDLSLVHSLAQRKIFAVELRDWIEICEGELALQGSSPSERLSQRLKWLDSDEKYVRTWAIQKVAAENTDESKQALEKILNDPFDPQRFNVLKEVRQNGQRVIREADGSLRMP